MFATPQLAARIDRAEGRLCAGIARGAAKAGNADGAVVKIGGGVAVFVGVGSPTNKMIGVGFDGVPSDAELDHVERLFARHRAPLQAEISTLAAPDLHATLVRRGYEPKGFENVLGCDVTTIEQQPPDGITMEPVSAGARDRWVDVIIEAWAHPDTGGIGGDTVPPSDELRRWLEVTMSVPGFEYVAARIDGMLAGGASLRIDEGVAQFAGAATLPAFRRRGVQTALLRWRLAQARGMHCDVAVVVTQPASKSQQNVQREGFALLYARQLLVKTP